MTRTVCLLATEQHLPLLMICKVIDTCKTSQNAYYWEQFNRNLCSSMALWPLQHNTRVTWTPLQKSIPDKSVNVECRKNHIQVTLSYVRIYCNDGFW